MATPEQRSRLRADIDVTTASLPDPDADAIYVQAGESYPDGAAQDAYARVIAIRRILASAAKLTSYRQNQTSENASDVFKHLRELLDLWRGELAEADAELSAGAARFGGLRSKPKRIKEYPLRTSTHMPGPGGTPR